MKKIIIAISILTVMSFAFLGYAQSAKDAQEELRKDFKGFRFRTILIGVSLEDQMPSCESLQYHSIPEPTYVPEPPCDQGFLGINGRKCIERPMQRFEEQQRERKERDIRDQRERKEHDIRTSQISCYSYVSEEDEYAIINLPDLGLNDQGTRVKLIDDKV